MLVIVMPLTLNILITVCASTNDNTTLLLLYTIIKTLNICADVPLRNYILTHPLVQAVEHIDFAVKQWAIVCERQNDTKRHKNTGSFVRN